jgi:hypothetical protein
MISIEKVCSTSASSIVHPPVPMLLWQTSPWQHISHLPLTFEALQIALLFHWSFDRPLFGLLGLLLISGK